jgi:hypothetical protein
MSLEAQSPGNGMDRGDAEINRAAEVSSSILPPAADIPAYVVLLITRTGMPRRKVYLDLGHAREAVARAEAKGQPARLVLCELTPVPGDLGGGGWSE